MFKRFLMAFVLFVTTQCYSQTFEGYFINRGCASLSKVAHASNEFKTATYDIKSTYVDVDVRSTDAFLGGNVYTSIRLYRGKGDLYFDRISVTSDTDYYSAFQYFGSQASFIVKLIEAMDKDAYTKMKNAIVETFNTDISQWTGKMWALLAINLDYYDYMFSRK